MLDVVDFICSFYLVMYVKRHCTISKILRMIMLAILSINCLKVGHPRESLKVLGSNHACEIVEKFHTLAKRSPNAYRFSMVVQIIIHNQVYNQAVDHLTINNCCLNEFIMCFIVQYYSHIHTHTVRTIKYLLKCPQQFPEGIQ